MKANFYISLKPKTGKNIYIDEIIFPNEIEENYKNHLNFCKDGGMEKIESFEGFKLVYLYLENVEFDGRKNKIMHDDVCRTLEKQGYATTNGSGCIFGGFYNPTEKLIEQFEKQLATRKQLISEGIFTNLKEIA